MSAVVEVVTLARCAPERLFDLSLDMDAHAASLAHTGERAVTSTGSPVLRLGDEVTFSARHFGIPWRLTARVVELERPHRFVDEQVRGPFAALRHEHLFAPDGAGGTRMTDRVHLAAPLGPLGRPVARRVLVPHLARLLRTRGGHLARVADGLG